MHSEYSLLDGAARISKLAKVAREKGMPAIAITDHGNMYGTYKFYKAVKKHNAEAAKKGLAPIKAIIGCEIYIVDDMRSREFKEHIAHLVLLAKNNKGYLNLCKINSAAWIDGFYKKPRIDYDFLERHSEGIICLSGCPAGHVLHYLGKGMYDEAKKYATRLKNIFGEDFYIELQDQLMDETKFTHTEEMTWVSQTQTNPILVKLADELGIEVVATNDVHYLYAEDAEMQDALVCITTKKTIDDPDRMNMLELSDQFYLKDRAEMNKVFGHIPRALDNTVVIAEKCNCHPFEKADLMPIFNKEGVTDNVEYFRNQIEKGLCAKYGEPIPTHVQQRYEEEFRIINDNHFVDYFLVVADFMEFANRAGIAATCRGSGAGSIIAYALDITKLDPLKYSLLFERFLHSERVSMPDFDLDFCCNRRVEVINYVINKYGADHVCQIVTFGTLAAKAAIKDMARVFKMPYSEVDKITKPIPFMGQTVYPPYIPYIFDLKKVHNPSSEPGFVNKSEKEQEEAMEEYKKETEKAQALRTPELINLYKNQPEVRKIVDMALKIEGFPRNCSTHAAGVIICKTVVGDITPLARNGTDVTSQFDMKEIEELGMLKMDFLGLITLTDIQGTLNDIKQSLGKDIDLYSFEYNDPEVYKMIGSGDTDAVFQLESGGMKRLMKDLRPDCFEDIISAVALFRPGPMDMIPDFCRNKHDPSLTTYEHPMLESILKNTYGQIVYQEQVMDVFKIMGGYTLGQADMVRRAMGKKDVKEMDRQKDIFLNGKAEISGAIAKGVPKKVALSIYDKMAKFAGYAFNKSHAACYAYIAYQTAYLKRYYYPYYMANVLNNRVHKWDDMTHYINSVRGKGVQVLSPDINKSRAFFSVEGGKHIRFGLAALKNVGEAVIQSILGEREKGGTFTSFGDFCSRVDSMALNKRCLESLILGGAFDGLAVTRSSLMAAYPGIVKLLASQKKTTDTGQMDMFGTLLPKETVKIEIPKILEYDDFTKLKLEKEVVGIYLSGHPLAGYTQMFEEFSFNTSKIKKRTEEEPDDDAPEINNGQAVTFGAIIADVKKMLTKATKKEMAVLRVQDLYGSAEVMLFPTIYERYKRFIEKDAVVRIVGKVSGREGEETNIVADEISLLVGKTATQEAGVPPFAKGVPPPVTGVLKLYLKYNTKDEQLHAEVMNIISAYSGSLPVVVRCIASGDLASPAKTVRQCRAIKIELDKLLGEGNVIFG